MSFGGMHGYPINPARAWAALFSGRGFRNTASAMAAGCGGRGRGTFRGGRVGAAVYDLASRFLKRLQLQRNGRK